MKKIKVKKDNIVLDDSIFVYIAKVNDYLSNRELPDIIKERVNKILAEESKNQIIASYGLLKRAYKDVYKKDLDLNTISYRDNGKPINSEFCFSISHSSDLMVVAISNYDLGIDIQKEKKMPDNFFSFILNKNENESIKINPILFWCEKEATYKCYSNDLFFLARNIDTTKHKYLNKKIAFNNDIYYLSLTSNCLDKVFFINEKEDIKLYPLY